MQHDFIDHIIDQWRHARPDLDPGPMAIAARIARMNAVLERRLVNGLQVHGLGLGEFDALATLRRNPAQGLPPKRLIAEMLLSSGAMTHRIDRLEQAGLVARTPDPDDRRGVLVRLTAKGRAVVDAAVADRFAEARKVAALLSDREQQQLARLLRRLCSRLESDAP